MKNHPSILEYADFAFFLAFFILPPLFVPYEAQRPPLFSYSAFSVILSILLSVFLYLAVKYREPLKTSVFRGNFENNNGYCKDTSSRHFLNMLLVTGCTLCALTVNTMILSVIAERFLIIPTDPEFAIPTGISGTIRIVGVTAVFASYEELLYRFYFPHRLRSVCFANFSHLSQNRAALLCVESIPLLCFAFAHRYMGIFPVINALIAGIVLRICVKKTKTVWTACAVHTIYNMGILYLSFFSSGS